MAAPEAPAVTIVGVVLPEVGLNVRDAPSVDDGAVQYVALRDEELELTGETSEIDGIVWHQLADGNWVQGQYLEISERVPEAMPEATPEATPEGTSPTIGVVLPEIGLNVRDAPSVADGAVQYVALQGEELILSGQTVEAEGATWYELEDGNWVQGQYLEMRP
ncbi:MAG: SH3 domain-containing protein [Chloroflexi bacterium]|nr:SH3 domain-containing protein [Chloroflexota bacterium]